MVDISNSGQPAFSNLWSLTGDIKREIPENTDYYQQQNRQQLVDVSSMYIQLEIDHTYQKENIFTPHPYEVPRSAAEI